MTRFTLSSRLSVLGLGLLSWVAVSCSKADDATPQDGGGFGLSARLNTTPVPVAGSGGTLAFTRGYVVIDEVEFKGKLKNSGEVAYKDKQVTTIDLATGLASPAFRFAIPPATYTEIKLKVEIEDENNRPSVVTEGTYINAAGVSTPVRFELNSGEEFEAKSNREITIAVSTPLTSKIAFEPRVWFAPITATQLDNARRVNGVILINESTNAGLFSIIADRLDDSTDVIFE